MAVMTPDQLRQGRGAPPLQYHDIQRDAVVNQLGSQPAAPPTASTPGQSYSSFQRGGQTTQLPMGRGEQIGSLASSVGAEAGKQVMKQVGSRAAQAGSAAATGASTAGSLASGLGTMGVTIGTDYLAGKLKPKEEMPTFGGEFGDLTDSYGRRFEGAGPGTAGGAVKGAGYGTMVMPGIGTAIGAGVGALIGAATRNAPSAYSDFAVEDAATAVGDAYQKYLGRAASEDEIRNQLVGQGWNPNDGSRWVGEKGLFSVLGQIRDSPEAQAYRTRGAMVDQLGSGGEPTVETTVPAGAQRVTGSMSGSPVGKLEGFGGVMADGRSKLEASDSPKYQVARVLQKYPSTPEGLQQALEEINGLGLGTASIGGSKGDKLTFSGNVDPRFNGITTFDVIRGAGNGGEAWAWQPEGGSDAPATRGVATRSMPDSTGRDPFNGGGVAGDSDAIARIRAELQRILSGEPDREAMLAQMGGSNG